MAKTYGIPVSPRRSYRPIPEGPSASLPQLSHRVINTKKSSKTSDIINAVNKEKWTFLQRLLAIEEKHEQKKLARQKELQSKKTEQQEENQENNPAANGRWLFDQILDDDADDESNPDFTDGSSRDNNTSNKNSDQNLFISSLPSIKQSMSSPHEHGSTNSHYSESPSPSANAHPKEDSLMTRPKRKRPLRLPPILLPPLYTVRPRPLQEREFLTPTRIRGPITDEEWEDLYNCRYIRHATPKYALQLSSSQSSFYFP